MANTSKKTENTEKSATNQRIIGRPFPKGVSGNPAGKPKGTFSLLTILKRQLQKIPKDLKGKERKQYADLLIKKVLHKAIVEGDDATIRLIFNYIEGMPKQDFGWDKDKPFILAITDDKKEEIAKRIVGRRKPSSAGRGKELSD